MSSKKVVSKDTKVDEKTEEKEGGVTVKTVTTTVTTKYDDGSTEVSTKVNTITEGPSYSVESGDKKTIIPRDAKEKASREKVSTDKKFLEEALKMHNKYRKNHGVEELKLCDDLCQVAQAWANKLAEMDQMEHSNSGYGENVHWTSRDYSEVEGDHPVEHWYSEASKYDYKIGDYQKGTGHFSQVVWKGSKKLGIAKAKGSKNGGTYVVANYEPAGNYMGKFKENVFPEKK